MFAFQDKTQCMWSRSMTSRYPPTSLTGSKKDLLQLSSIDINDVELQNYDAALEMGNQLSLERHYDAKVSLDGTNNWKLDSLTVYDDAGLKKDAKLEANEKLSTTKLNALKNALDELISLTWLLNRKA